MRVCLQEGHSPFASHGLYTLPGVLDDDIPDERALGIRAGLGWYRVAEACFVFTDLGISNGMAAGIAQATLSGVPVIFRQLQTWAPKEAAE